MRQYHWLGCLLVNGSTPVEGIYWLQQGPSHEDRGVISRAAWANQKDDILAAFHLRLHLLELVLTVHRLLVDLQDDIATAQSHGVAEAIRLQVLHNDTLGVRQLETAIRKNRLPGSDTCGL